ncbi:ATP-binding protein [Herbiconiux daphne]|uniref:LuxR C-terminal-related transcriptional regulator n=1 Tax=Herbiconiux daphne TaxID=2970914 RepID=A0ABT2GWK8_9MICO|nr:LuxR family transcriptional regulator [Herbiconiux daphne]MCS5732351.1 LuxR C-terminal-related transcriptional regulator [Herbiconiux daphne]
MIGDDTTFSTSGFAVGRSALVGGSGIVDLAEQRWARASAGEGLLLLLAGEAGIGKSRMLREIADRIGTSARFLGGSTWPKDSEVAGSLLLDLADDLTRAGDTEHAARLTALLASRDRDDPLLRRILLHDLVAILLELLAEQPTVLRFEDLHWADELSLDVLARLATELPRMPGLVIATYRSDEVFAGSPLMSWRGRLLAQRVAEEVRLPRFDLAATGDLIAALTGAVAPTEFTALLHQRSDGIPLHIEELVVAGEGARVPDTLADAVRARAEQLDAETKDVLAAAAIVGCRFDLGLLTELLDADDRVVDQAMRSLLDHSFIVETAAGFEFRHALLRDVVHDDVPPLRRRALHEVVALAAVARHARPAFISEHFELAGLPDAAYPYALDGARSAAHVSAHREAARLYRRAVLTRPETVGGCDRARLHAECARELASNDEVADAAEHYRLAIDLYRSEGDPVAAARLVPPSIAVRHLLGDDLDTRCAVVRATLADLDGLPGGGPEAVRAELLASLAAAHMLDRRLDSGLSFALEAQTLAAAAPDGRLDIDIRSTLGALRVFAGRGDEGWAGLASAIEAGRAAGFEAESARAYRMAASSASVLVEYDLASGWLDAGIDYAAETENWNDHNYLTAHLAHVRWAQGRWPEADQLARRALADAGGITTRVTALHVLGFLAVGRGRFGEAAATLREARAIGERMGELQRLAPALWGLAELASAEGDAAQAVELSEQAYRASASVHDAAYLFPFVVTGTRARLTLHHSEAARDWLARCSALLLRRGIPGTLPALDHAEGLLQLDQGRTGAARELLERAERAWQARGRFWEGTFALTDLARCALRSRRSGEAAAYLDRVRERADASGADLFARLAGRIARSGLAGAGGDAAGPLTAREFEVARLVASGATNREIATALTISPKTVSAHVEHILAKLGAARRTEIASWVAQAPVAR